MIVCDTTNIKQRLIDDGVDISDFALQQICRGIIFKQFVSYLTSRDADLGEYLSIMPSVMYGAIDDLEVYAESCINLGNDLLSR